ncbi:hypothetical protein ACHQM5_024305 [Ranunculus cassubicifolius]
MASTLSKKHKTKKSQYTLKDLKKLGNQLLSSKANLNNLSILITFISPSTSPQNALEVLLSLQSFFIPLIPDIPSSKTLTNHNDNDGSGSDSKDPDLIYQIWLRRNFDDFVKALINVAVSKKSDEYLRDAVLDAIMEFVRLGKDGKFQSSIYQNFLHAIVYSKSDVDTLIDSLATKFFKYIDVRYFTYIGLEKLARTLSTRDIKDDDNLAVQVDSEHIPKPSEHAVRKMHYILSHIPPFEIKEGESSHEMWSESGLSSKETDGKRSKEADQKKTVKKGNNATSSSQIAKKMKLKFTKAWLSLLRLPLPLDVYKEILVSLHQTVMPYLSNPIMLCDFLTSSYDIGGVTSVMALSSLFILMTQHGLEYPNFYQKLYALLVPSVFMAKHRAKFLELLDSCLKSHHLPAYLAAAFTKKLSRLALVVPPSGALVIIALVHNLLRRHPSINFLVHKQTDETDESTKDADMSNSSKPGVDLFDNEELDPAKCNAMRSSLWEIDTLRHHYCPAVSRFVASLENDLTVRTKTSEVTVADFSSASFATVFRAEIGRRVKQVPLAFYKTTPATLFSESDFPGWAFKLDAESNKRQKIECS